MQNIYKTTGIQVKIIEVSHDDTKELNNFLTKHDGNIIDIQTVGMMHGVCKFIITYKAPENIKTDDSKISGIIFEHGKDDYGLWEGFLLSKKDEEAIWQILQKYDSEGCSVRGTRKEIVEEIAC